MAYKVEVTYQGSTKKKKLKSRISVRTPINFLFTWDYQCLFLILFVLKCIRHILFTHYILSNLKKKVRWVSDGDEIGISLRLWTLVETQNKIHSGPAVMASYKHTYTSTKTNSKRNHSRTGHGRNWTPITIIFSQ